MRSLAGEAVFGLPSGGVTEEHLGLARVLLMQVRACWEGEGARGGGGVRTGFKDFVHGIACPPGAGRVRAKACHYQ